MPRIRTLDVSKHGDKANTLLAKLRVVGQPDAVTSLVNVVDRYDGGLYSRTQPISNLLFLGPTGSGKTYTVESFVEVMFGNPKKMFKIDCAEFQHSHEIAKLIGSPPGYLGHRETHAIITTEKLKAMQEGGYPFSVILFDEIEKASDGLWNLLLGILDKGTLRLGDGNEVDLTSTVIVMTSNLGSKEMAAKTGGENLGFTPQSSITEGVPVQVLKDIAVNAARRKFTPEFMNRINDIVMFNTLTKDNLRDILELELTKIREMIVRDGLRKPILTVTPAASAQLLEDGYDAKYGARHLKRAVEKYVMLPVSRAMASQQINDLDMVLIDYKEGFTYQVEETV